MDDTPQILDLEIFRVNDFLPITPPVHEFFGGMLSLIQTRPVLPVAAGMILVLAGLAFFRRRMRPLFWQNLSLGLIAVLSVLLSLKVSEGWDEFFINLRHSYVLTHAGHYSYNAAHMAEGTVDFLPFFLTGLLGKLSFPLVETAICFSLLGNVLVIVAGWLILRALVVDEPACLAFTLALGIFPCVIFVGGSGFMATLFTGLILLSVYFLFLALPEKRWAGLVILAFLPLVRIEGILFTFLMWLCLCLARPSFKKALGTGLLLAAPFAFLTLARKFFFGHPIPAPVIFKNTAGDPAYLRAGLGQLRFLLQYFQLHIFALLSVIPIGFCFYKKLLPSRIFLPVGAAAVFCSLYFTGGGDWFPFPWNRYLMPFTLLFTICAWAFIYKAMTPRVRHQGARTAIALALIVSPYIWPAPNAFQTLYNDLRSSRNRWGRIDDLGFFGRYLGLTLPANAVIASPEMATVMYFAEHDLLDLLGIANPEVAYAPLDPLVPGDLMHRRHFPQAIDRHLPEVVGLWGMATLGPQDFPGFTPEQMKEELVQRFKEFYFTPAYYFFNRWDIAHYRAGELSRLAGLGYHFLVVSTPEGFFNYFVHDKIYPAHVAAVTKLGGVALGKSTLSYVKPPGRANFLIVGRP